LAVGVTKKENSKNENTMTMIAATRLAAGVIVAIAGYYIILGVALAVQWWTNAMAAAFVVANIPRFIGTIGMILCWLWWWGVRRRRTRTTSKAGIGVVIAAIVVGHCVGFKRSGGEPRREEYPIQSSKSGVAGVSQSGNEPGPRRDILIATAMGDLHSDDEICVGD
jgi:hypothetical protein